MFQDCRENEPLLQKKCDELKAEVLHPTGDLSIPGAALILVCTAVGAGIVALPRAFSLAGWAAGLFALMVSAALSVLSLSALFKCAQLERKPSTYQSLVRKYLPPGISLFIDIAASLLLLGAVGTMLLLAMHVWESLELAVGIAPLSPSHMPWALLLVELLLCLPRNFTELQWVTVVNLCATVSAVSIICIQSAHIIAKYHTQTGMAEKPSPVGISAITSPSGLLAAFPITLYGFFCQFQAPQLYAEMQPSQRHSTFLCSGVAIAACFFVYAFVGFLGYAAFGVKTGSDILKQLTEIDPTNHWLCLGQLLFGFVLLLSTPLVLAPLRTMLLRSTAEEDESFIEKKDVSAGGHVAATALILVSAMTIALSVPGVDFIMGFLGATCVVFLALIVPGLLTLQCCGSDWKIAGWILVVAGFMCTPLTFGHFVAHHLGYLP